MNLLRLFNTLREILTSYGIIMDYPKAALVTLRDYSAQREKQSSCDFLFLCKISDVELYLKR